MSEIKQDKIQVITECLAAMPEGGSPPTKRKTVALLAGEIQRARDKGYTLKQIVGQLQNSGFDIGYATLRNALPRQKKMRSGSKKPRVAAKDDPRTRAVPPLSRAAPREREPTPRAVAPAKAPDGAASPLAFPPGASSVPAGDGRFVPAPDSDVL